MKNIIFNLDLFSTILIASLGGVVGQRYSSSIRCLERERQALLKFKDEVVDEYGRLSSWGVGSNKRECCKWRGVYCHNNTNRVARLNLRGPSIFHPLQGNISSSLLELKHLAYLDLSNNGFGSNIPQFFGSLDKLQYLNLSRSNFQGSIPPSLGNLTELMYLDFTANALLYSDDLDWLSHLASLKYLSLSEVWLANSSNWLQAISKLTSIKEILCGYCQLQDIHPSALPLINSSAPLAFLDLTGNFDISSSTFQWFLNFSKSLTFIDLSLNNITDITSDHTFDNQNFLAFLDLSFNSIAWGIPKSLGNMSSLTFLNFQKNHLTAQLSELMANLSGPLERKLQHLDLRQNMITGSLPNFSGFSFLKHLSLGGNKLNDSIANDFLNIPYLIDLDLSSNNFTGTLPDLTTFPFLENLVLGSNNFEGVVTETHLFNLSHLKTLDLSLNVLLTVNCSPDWVPPFQLNIVSLSGCNIGRRFPQWLQFQRMLEYLDISSCQIEDNVPHWFGNLPSRPMYLNASNNDIHGIIPQSFFNLTIYDGGEYRLVLDLSRNKFRGEVPFLCHMFEWRIIDLSDNLFFGHVPDCVANFTYLKSLNLASNHFVGEIPNSLGSLVWLYSLDLRNNSLSGGIPTSMSNCRSLESIQLGENMLTGSIPTWIGDALPELIVLSLNLNKLRGTIPSSICSLQKIQVLDLSSNMISGPMPRCLSNLSAMSSEEVADLTFYGYNDYYMTSLVGVVYDNLPDGAFITWKGKNIKYVNGNLMLFKLIDLSDNLLVGDIPSEITQLVGLVMLNLSRNDLSGQIPQSIGHLENLNVLDLSRNRLSGGIPTSISELSSLGVLDLSYNNLLGRIPSQYYSFDGSSYAGNPGLCGPILLNKSCPGESDTNPQDSNFNNDSNAMKNWEHEDDDKFITEGFYICMISGFVVGFWVIFGTMLLSNSARFVHIYQTVEDFVYVRVELSKARLRNRFQS